MAPNRSAVLRTVNSSTWKIYDRRISKWIPVVGVYRELLPMACLRENQQKVLAESQSIRKRQGPQEQKKPVIEP